jgi:hypothetical protein
MNVAAFPAVDAKPGDCIDPKEIPAARALAALLRQEEPKRDLPGLGHFDHVSGLFLGVRALQQMQP